jgi:hypothetical protein
MSTGQLEMTTDELHSAMREGRLAEIAAMIARAQIGFAFELPGMRESVRTTLRESGMEAVAELFLLVCNEAYVPTFGAPLPPDLSEGFKTAFRKTAAECVERWLASHDAKS